MVLHSSRLGSSWEGTCGTDGRLWPHTCSLCGPVTHRAQRGYHLSEALRHPGPSFVQSGHVAARIGDAGPCPSKTSSFRWPRQVATCFRHRDGTHRKGRGTSNGSRGIPYTFVDCGGEAVDAAAPSRNLRSPSSAQLWGASSDGIAQLSSRRLMWFSGGRSRR